MYFVSDGRLRGTSDRTSRVTSRCSRLTMLEPDVGDDHLPRVEAAGGDLEPDLAAVHGHGHVRPDRGAGDLARVGVDARWQVDRDDRDAGSVDLLYELRGLGPRLAAESGAEQRVDQDVAARAFLRLPSGGAKHLERDPTVASVRAAAAHRPERLASGKRRSASSATARPARSIIAGTSWPASAAFISAAV